MKLCDPEFFFQLGIQGVGIGHEGFSVAVSQQFLNFGVFRQDGGHGKGLLAFLRHLVQEELIKPAQSIFFLLFDQFLLRVQPHIHQGGGSQKGK